MKIKDDARCSFLEMYGIDTVAAMEHIYPFFVIEMIIPRSTVECVIARPTINLIAEYSAYDEIVAFTPFEGIANTIARCLVGVGVKTSRICNDEVFAFAAVQNIRFIVSDQYIVMIWTFKYFKVVIFVIFDAHTIEAVWVIEIPQIQTIDLV